MESITSHKPEKEMGQKELNERLNFLLTERDSTIVSLKKNTEIYEESMSINTDQVLEMDEVHPNDMLRAQNFLSVPRPTDTSIKILKEIELATKRLQGIENELNKLSKLLVIN